MKILVLPGTAWQVPLIEKMKTMGHEVHLVNPVKNKGVYEIADYFLEADIFSYDTITAYCKAKGINAVMSEECDIATDIVAKINKEIGANCISEELASLFTDKSKMREFCHKHDFNPIPYRLCKTKDEAIAFYKIAGPKAIMKPLDSNASHGVFTVNSEMDIMENFEKTLQFSRNMKSVLLEKYIEGTEFTVDGIMTKKGHATLAISEKKHYAHNDNIANALFFTQSNSKYNYELLRKINDRLINATKLPFGLTHVEYKYSNGKYYLIEMAARGGGNLISAVIAPFMSSVDSYDYLIRQAVDSEFDCDIVPKIDNDKTAILKFLDLPCEGGVVKEIHGEDYMIHEPRVKSYKLNFSVGDYILQPESDSVRAGYYIICADTKREFDEVLKNISERFVIEFEER